MVEFYNKEQINALKTKPIKDEFAKKISEDALALIQNSIVEHASRGEGCFEVKSFPENETAKDKVVSTLKGLGYSIDDSQSKTTVKIDRNKCKLTELSDVVSVDNLELYMKSPVMPAYCALAILELSKESEKGSMILIINEVVDRVVNKINGTIAEKISKTGAFNTSIEVYTCDNDKYLSITDEIFAGVENVIGTPSERLFRDICLKGCGYRLVQKEHGVIAEFNGEDFEGYIMDFESRTIVTNVLRAPVLAKLTKELNRSGLKFEGAGWDSSIIAITID